MASSFDPRHGRQAGTAAPLTHGAAVPGRKPETPAERQARRKTWGARWGNVARMIRAQRESK